jgi:hypothetical protein
MPFEDLKSVDSEHDRLWREEIKRRHQEYKEGKAKLWDADEVIAKLLAEIGKARLPVGES